MFDNSKILKFDSVGLVDVAATVAAFTEAVTEYAGLQKADQENCAVAVASVWTDAPNLKTISLSALAGMAAHKMGATAGDLAVITERCADYIRNAKALYKIAKGRNGGVSRVTAEPTPAS